VLGPNSFITSNEAGSLTVWKRDKDQYSVQTSVTYDPNLGVSNSGAVLRSKEGSWLVTGHANGYVAIWNIDEDPIVLENTISIRSTNPVPSPHKLWNVRSILAWKDNLVVTGSEDGDICILRIPDGAVLARKRYSSDAKLGINSLSLSGNLLLATNCTVSHKEKNLWLYRLAQDRISLLDSIDLEKPAPTPGPLHSFNAVLVDWKGQFYFLASTGQGFLWFGRIIKEELKIVSEQEVSCGGGAALALDADQLVLATVAHTIRLFSLTPRPNPGIHPSSTPTPRDVKQ
jgi:hypothetical protein